MGSFSSSSLPRHGKREESVEGMKKSVKLENRVDNEGMDANENPSRDLATGRVKGELMTRGRNFKGNFFITNKE